MSKLKSKNQNLDELTQMIIRDLEMSNDKLSKATMELYLRQLLRLYRSEKETMQWDSKEFVARIQYPNKRICQQVMARKWLQLVGEDGRDLTSATSVAVDVEDVDTLRKAVKEECPNSLANVDAADLTLFENRAKYDAKEALEEDGSFGGTKKDASSFKCLGAQKSLQVISSFLKLAQKLQKQCL
ncbi:unnamed protein product [Phytophthora lilii]|uniref:Unnamed protein product n=1 Tax=Phytophthora lilii TaxID=2077276 RepID=A0A9W7CHF5_9STRA|nr:unnamed protein product [Phytophthora lilii]